MKFATLVAAALLWSMSAQAGPLLSAQLVTTVSGAFINITDNTVSGNLDGAGNYSIDPGAFTTPVALTTDVSAAGGAAVITTANINFAGLLAAVSGNTGTVGSVGVTGGGIAGTGAATGNALGQMGLQLAAIAVSYGGNATGAQPPFALTIAGVLTLATLTISAPTGDLWHLGTVSATGLFTGMTTAPVALPNVTVVPGVGFQLTQMEVLGTNTVTTNTLTFTHGVNVTGGGNTEVTLVTLAKTRVRTFNAVQGTQESLTATPVFLRLTYGPMMAPEPGTLLLLGAGLLGLASVGRRKS